MRKILLGCLMMFVCGNVLAEPFTVNSVPRAQTGNKLVSGSMTDDGSLVSISGDVTVSESLEIDGYLYAKNMSRISFNTSKADAVINISNTSTGPTLQTELITNGSITDDLTGWTNGGNWSYSAGTALHTAGSTATLSQSVAVVGTASYYISITISGRTAGSITVSVGTNTPMTQRTATTSTGYKQTTGGTVSFTITPTSDFDGAVDNITLKRLTESTSLNNLYSSSGTIVQENRDSLNYGTFLGYTAGRFDYLGQYNSAFGYGSFASNIAGSNSSCFGYGSCANNIDGLNNSAFGYIAGQLTTTGSSNTSIGYYANNSNTIGSGNTAIGANAGRSNQQGSDNVFIGINSGYNASVSTGTFDRNVLIGRESGDTLTGDADYNILIGYNAQPESVGGDYQLNIGGAIKGNLSTGNIGIGTGLANAKLQIDGALYVNGGSVPTHAVVALGTNGNALIGGHLEIDGDVYLDGVTGTGSFLCIDATNKPYRNTTCP